jgi:hypothetical protein
MTPKPLAVRLQLTESEARALHNAVLEAIAVNLLPVAHVETAQQVLGRLGAHVPSWLDRSAVQGDAGYMIAADAVLRTLVDAEERGRSALTEIELPHELGDAKPVGVSIHAVLARMRREKLIRIAGASDGATSSAARSPGGAPKAERDRRAGQLKGLARRRCRRAAGADLPRASPRP